MAALPDLITVAQLDQLPERPGFRYELHHGELVSMTVPKNRHINLQRRLMHLLEPKLREFGPVLTECPYRAVSEFEFRRADVAAVSKRRWDEVDPDDNLYGAPELMIEVRSPSNTGRQLRELIALCLGTGSLQCWIVEPEKKSVSVFRRDGTQDLYGPGTQIPLADFGAGALPVDEIFA